MLALNGFHFQKNGVKGLNMDKERSGVLLLGEGDYQRASR
jgi:hypothetical protein